MIGLHRHEGTQPETDDPPVHRVQVLGHPGPSISPRVRSIVPGPGQHGWAAGVRHCAPGEVAGGIGWVPVWSTRYRNPWGLVHWMAPVGSLRFFQPPKVLARWWSRPWGMRLSV